MRSGGREVCIKAAATIFVGWEVEIRVQRAPKHRIRRKSFPNYVTGYIIMAAYDIHITSTSIHVIIVGSGK